MSFNFRTSLIFMFGLLAFFVFAVGVSAQEIDKERAIQLVSQIGGPGGCTDEASCSDFCENTDNYETCVQWAQDNGLMRSEQAEKAKRLARQARDFSGPGGCSGPEQCHAFCEQPQNHDTCIDFAVSQGFMSREDAERIRGFREEAERFREEAERERERFEEEFEVDPDFDKERALQIVESQGGPGGCRTFEECEQFCERPENQQACFEFAEEHGLFKNREQAEKIKRIMVEGGPGGCKGEIQCRQFCESPENFETCIEFAEKNELIPKEEVERAKKGIQALKEGGPAGCRSQSECDQVCRKPENQEACFEWAKKHGLIPESELRRIEEFKKRGEELRREFEQRREEFEDRGEDFRPPEGFQPPGEFLGPGGCAGAEECRKYCEDPAHQDECGGFRTPGDSQPPGFGGTAPGGESGQFPVPSEFELIRQCGENGGFWTGSTCEFRKEGEYRTILPPTEFTPPSDGSEPNSYEGQYPQYSPPPEYQPQPEPKQESIIQETGAYVLKAFRDFLR